MQVYRWQIQMATSIVHRATGIILAVGALLIAAALLAMATGPEAWDWVRRLAGSWLGLAVLFGFRLPYVMAMHQAPTDDGHWQSVSHLHLEFMPPHRTAGKLKYLAGSESAMGVFINDVVPEDAAKLLRDAA